MASFSLKLTARAALVAAAGLTLTGCTSMGGRSSASAPAPVSNPCGTTTCSAPEPEKKGFLGLCSHDKGNRQSLLARLSGHNKEQPHQLAPGEFIVSYGEGPPPMYATPAYGAQTFGAPSCGTPACATPIGSCLPEPYAQNGGMIPSMSGIMPAPTISTPCSPSATTVVPSGVLPPAPVTNQPPPLAPNTVAPPSGLPNPSGTPQAQPMPAPGSTTSKTFTR